MFPDDRERIMASIGSVFGEKQQFWSDEYRFRRHDGSYAYVIDRGYIMYDVTGKAIRMIGAITNFSERKEAEEKIHASEERYRSLIENVPDVIYTLDQELNYTSINPAGERFYGMTKEELIGKNLETIIAPRLSAMGMENSREMRREKIEQGGITTYQLDMKLADGSDGIVEVVSWFTYDNNNQPNGTQGILRDITERILSEEKVKASLQEKEILLKEIHHRVKNNLQVISSLLYLQSRKSRDENVQTMFLESQNRIASMALIHEKLYQSTDLAHLSFVEYVRDMAGPLFHAYGVEHAQVTLAVEDNGLALDINNAVPCGLIINEIVSNSLKYAFPDQRAGKISITLSLESDERFNLTLSDDGAGLPADFQQRSAASLGSKLIERLVEQIHGKVERSSSAQGTRYVISFACEV